MRNTPPDIRTVSGHRAKLTSLPENLATVPHSHRLVLTNPDLVSRPIEIAYFTVPYPLKASSNAVWGTVTIFFPEANGDWVLYTLHVEVVQD